MVTDSEIREMLRNYRADLRAFEEAKNILGRRMTELEEGDPGHYENFVKWPATQVVANGLILCISKCMGVIEDLENNLKQRNAPVFKLVAQPGDEEDDDV